MGYTTDFEGSLELSRPLTQKEKNYINTFSDTRRMSRDPQKLMELYHGEFGHPTPESNTPGGIYGVDGEYFAKDDGQCGQTSDDSINDYNTPPGQIPFGVDMDFNERYSENNRRASVGESQPGLWCQWIIEGDAPEQYLTWDGGEKFYNYIEWLRYLIVHFFGKWGVLLNGEIDWFGEEREDMGKIVVKDNVITVKEGHVSYD